MTHTKPPSRRAFHSVVIVCACQCCCNVICESHAAVPCCFLFWRERNTRMRAFIDSRRSEPNVCLFVDIHSLARLLCHETASPKSTAVCGKIVFTLCGGDCETVVRRGLCFGQRVMPDGRHNVGALFRGSQAVGVAPLVTGRARK